MDGEALLLYDGVCGLCHGFVRFIARRDRAQVVRFAPLQGDYARALLAHAGADAASLDSLALVVPSQVVLLRSRAVLRVMQLLGGGWQMLARCMGWLPVPLLDWLYDVVARERYRAFGRLAVCPALPPQWRDRFIA